MKKLLFTILTVVTALSAMAQSDPVFAPQSFAIATCAASAATNVAYVIDFRKQKDVMLQIESTNDASGTAAVTLALSRSLDGITYGTSLDVIAVTPNGTTKVVTLTNYPSWGAGYAKIAYVTNAAATANVGSLIIRYGIKIKAP